MYHCHCCNIIMAIRQESWQVWHVTSAHDMSWYLFTYYLTWVNICCLHSAPSNAMVNGDVIHMFYNRFQILLVICNWCWWMGTWKYFLNQPLHLQFFVTQIHIQDSLLVIHHLRKKLQKIIGYWTPIDDITFSQISPLLLQSCYFIFHNII